MGVLHVVVKKGVGYILGVLLYIKGGYILGGSHIDLRCLKGGGYILRGRYTI